MTWPTGPPPMPPQGWYDDTEQPWTWRYWDGAAWTDHRAPMWVPPVRDPLSFSAWFERSVAAVKLAVRRVGLVLASLWLVLGVLGSWFVVAVFDSDRGQELRRLLEFDETPVGPSGSTVTVELTTREAERARELLQEMFWSALPWLVVLAVVVIAASAWSVALVARAVQRRIVDQAVTTDVDDTLGTIAVDALRRVPAVVASGFVVFLVFMGIWLIGSVPVVLVAVAGGGTAAIVLTVLFVVVLLVVVTAWLWGRLTLASAIAGAGGHGLGLRRSWELTTHGRFWFVVSRLVVTGLLAGAASGVVNIVTTFGQFLGFVVFVVAVVLLQAIAVAASIIVTVCGYLVTADQADHGAPVSESSTSTAPPQSASGWTTSRGAIHLDRE